MVVVVVMQTSEGGFDDAEGVPESLTVGGLGGVCCGDL